MYQIREGNHYADGAVLRLLNYRWRQSHLFYKASFTDDCWYQREVVSSSGINKLCGFSYGLFGVHRNSLRIGWVPDYNRYGKIKLYAYYYIQGEGHFKEYITSVETNDIFNISFLDILTMPKICVCIGTEYSWIPEAEFKNMAVCPLIHLHYPYFGGRDAAYWDMDINLREI